MSINYSNLGNYVEVYNQKDELIKRFDDIGFVNNTVVDLDGKPIQEIIDLEKAGNTVKITPSFRHWEDLTPSTDYFKLVEPFKCDRKYPSDSKVEKPSAKVQTESLSKEPQQESHLQITNSKGEVVKRIYDFKVTSNSKYFNSRGEPLKEVEELVNQGCKVMIMAIAPPINILRINDGMSATKSLLHPI